MQKFAATAPIAAVLDIPAGRIQMIAADRSDTTVDIRPADASRSRDVKAAEQVNVEYAGGVLRVAVESKNQLFGPSGSIELTVQLPAGSRVEVKGAGTDFRAVGRLGDVAYESAQAAVKIDEASSARITVQAGDVEIGRLTGPGEISTGKGDVRIAEAVRGKLVLTTQAGDLSVGAAAGVSASLDAGATHGRVDNALRNTGDAALEIRATTAHGDITARSL
jgi:DUF4097 and DUF4098 domain-containing protein YvlB